MKHKTIDFPIWEKKLHIYEYWSCEKIEKEIQKIQLERDKIIDYDLFRSIAFHFQIDQDLYIFRNTKDKDILLHEIYHAISSIQDSIWLPMSKDNDEFWAYLLSYICREIDIFKK